MADGQVPGFGDDESPSFGDVVKAFTPPGTDFEEFKQALHSQGAPQAISPQLVAMLNQAAAAGAIPGEMLEHSGQACVRCDHVHPGPPGQACLEAEAHLGRSPDRRRPDVQLDAISGRGGGRVPSPPAATAETPPVFTDFPPGMPSVSAVAAHEQYIDFRRAGFTLDEAVRLLAALIAASKTDNSDTEN